MRKILQILGLMLVAWLVAAGAAEAVAHTRLPRGRMIDIGGRRLRLICEGPKSDAPTIWMEAGAFSGAADFGAIQQRLAEQGLRTCAYDRAGLGFSDVGPSPRDGDAIAGDFDKLLVATREHRPVILMAHSMGGLYVRQFAAQHPDKVAGVVLIEAVTPELLDAPGANAFINTFLTMARLNAVGGTLQLTKPAYLFLADRIGLPDDARREKRRGATSGRQARAALDEVNHWRGAAKQAKAAGAYDPAWPVAVITAGRPGQLPGVWETARRAPADQSKAGSYDPVAGASHASILGFDHNTAIITATVRVVASAQAGTHVTQAPRLEGP